MLAYHFVRGGLPALQAVLREGAILPGAYRLPLWALRAGCQSYIDRLRRKPDPKEDLARAVEHLLDRRMKDIQLVRQERTLQASESGFLCEDLLAGDTFYVFLALENWSWPILHSRGHQPPNGFVFDAHDLVTKGAILREQDNASRYQAVLRRLAGMALQAPELARLMIDGFQEILLEDLSEDAAHEALDALDLRGLGPANPFELLYPSPLTVEWALEVWAEGVRA